MAKYDVGFGKPPESGRFRSGVSGNPKGRPKRKSSTYANASSICSMLRSLIARAAKPRSRPGGSSR